MKVDVQVFELRDLEGARGFLRAAAAADAAFTVRAEVDDRLETSTLGAAGGAAKLMDELGFNVLEESLGDDLWRPRRGANKVVCTLATSSVFLQPPRTQNSSAAHMSAARALAKALTFSARRIPPRAKRGHVRANAETTAAPSELAAAAASACGHARPKPRAHAGVDAEGERAERSAVSSAAAGAAADMDTPAPTGVNFLSGLLAPKASGISARSPAPPCSLTRELALSEMEPVLCVRECRSCAAGPPRCLRACGVIVRKGDVAGSLRSLMLSACARATAPSAHACKCAAALPSENFFATAEAARREGVGAATALLRSEGGSVEVRGVRPSAPRLATHTRTAPPRTLPPPPPTLPLALRRHRRGAPNSLRPAIIPSSSDEAAADEAAEVGAVANGEA